MSQSESERNPFTTTIAKMRTQMADFFWDAFMVLSVNDISGDYVEFGSWGANSITAAYEAVRDIGRPRHLWAFDSFQALPPVTHPRDARWKGPGFGQGGVDRFHEACAERGVPREAYTAVEGYYDATLPPLGADGAPADIALVYVDCNMYTSTVTVFDFLAPRLKHGMIVAFDDYFLYTARELSGERAALREFEVAHPEWRFLPYKDVHYAGTSFIVERADLLPGGG
jgi:hypothetical protein